MSDCQHEMPDNPMVSGAKDEALSPLDCARANSVMVFNLQPPPPAAGDARSMYELMNSWHKQNRISQSLADVRLPAQLSSRRVIGRPDYPDQPEMPLHPRELLRQPRARDLLFRRRALESGLEIGWIQGQGFRRNRSSESHFYAAGDVLAPSSGRQFDHELQHHQVGPPLPERDMPSHFALDYCARPPPPPPPPPSQSRQFYQKSATLNKTGRSMASNNSSESAWKMPTPIPVRMGSIKALEKMVRAKENARKLQEPLGEAEEQDSAEALAQSRRPSCTTKGKAESVQYFVPINMRGDQNVQYIMPMKSQSQATTSDGSAVSTVREQSGLPSDAAITHMNAETSAQCLSSFQAESRSSGSALQAKAKTAHEEEKENTQSIGTQQQLQLCKTEIETESNIVPLESSGQMTVAGLDPVQDGRSPRRTVYIEYYIEPTEAGATGNPTQTPPTEKPCNWASSEKQSNGCSDQNCQISEPSSQVSEKNQKTKQLTRRIESAPTTSVSKAVYHDADSTLQNGSNFVPVLVKAEKDTDSEKLNAGKGGYSSSTDSVDSDAYEKEADGKTVMMEAQSACPNENGENYIVMRVGIPNDVLYQNEASQARHRSSNHDAQRSPLKVESENGLQNVTGNAMMETQPASQSHSQLADSDDDVLIIDVEEPDDIGETQTDIIETQNNIETQNDTFIIIETQNDTFIETQNAEVEEAEVTQSRHPINSGFAQSQRRPERVTSNEECTLGFRILETVSLAGLQPSSQTSCPKHLSAEGFYRCGCQRGQCPFASQFQAQFESHLLQAHPAETEYPCIHCGSMERSGHDLLFHLDQHLDFQRFILYCTEPACDFHSFSPDSVLSHMGVSHPELATHTCWHCGRLSGSLRDFSAHVKSSLLQVALCPHCDAKDTDGHRIVQHIAAQHPRQVRMIAFHKLLVCRERKMSGWNPESPCSSATVEGTDVSGTNDHGSGIISKGIESAGTTTGHVALLRAASGVASGICIVSGEDTDTDGRMTPDKMTQNRMTPDKVTRNRMTQNRRTPDKVKQKRMTLNRMTPDRMTPDKMTQNKMTQNRMTQNRMTQNRMTPVEVTPVEVTQNRMTQNRMTQNRMTPDEVTQNRMTRNRMTPVEVTQNRMTPDKMTQNRMTPDKMTQNRMTQNRMTQDSRPGTSSSDTSVTCGSGRADGNTVTGSVAESGRATFATPTTNSNTVAGSVGESGRATFATATTNSNTVAGSVAESGRATFATATTNSNTEARETAEGQVESTVDSATAATHSLESPAQGSNSDVDKAPDSTIISCTPPKNSALPDLGKLKLLLRLNKTGPEVVQSTSGEAQEHAGMRTKMDLEPMDYEITADTSADCSMEVSQSDGEETASVSGSSVSVTQSASSSSLGPEQRGKSYSCTVTAAGKGLKITSRAAAKAPCRPAVPGKAAQRTRMGRKAKESSQDEARPQSKSAASRCKFYRCLLCPYSSRFSPGIYQHMYSRHKEILECPLCGEQSQTRTEFFNHLMTLHPEEAKDTYKQRKVTNWISITTPSSSNDNTSSAGQSSPPKLPNPVKRLDLPELPVKDYYVLSGQGKERRFHCVFCDYSFKKSQRSNVNVCRSMYKHMFLMHTPCLFQCSHCSYTDCVQDKVKKHIDEDHSHATQTHEPKMLLLPKSGKERLDFYRKYVNPNDNLREDTSASESGSPASQKDKDTQSVVRSDTNIDVEQLSPEHSTASIEDPYTTHQYNPPALSQSVFPERMRVSSSTESSSPNLRPEIQRHMTAFYPASSEEPTREEGVQRSELQRPRDFYDVKNVGSQQQFSCLHCNYKITGTRGKVSARASTIFHVRRKHMAGRQFWRCSVCTFRWSIEARVKNHCLRQHRGKATVIKE